MHSNRWSGDLVVWLSGGRCVLLRGVDRMGRMSRAGGVAFATIRVSNPNTSSPGASARKTTRFQSLPDALRPSGSLESGGERRVVL